MKKKLIRLLSPTVRELIAVLKQLPPDAFIAAPDVDGTIGLNIESHHQHWEDDGDGYPVDYNSVEFYFYSLD